MIENALILLREELSSYMTAHGDPASVVIENIGLLGSDKDDLLRESLVIALVNIEQENSLKNAQVYQKNETAAIYENPPVYLNLYVLVSANFNSGTPPNNGYLLALKRLSLAIKFFQGKSVFTPASSTINLPAPLNDLSNPEISSLRLVLELHSLSFEQVNHLWGSLGGRQIPSVLYKVRMVTISERKALREAPLIEEIHIQTQKYQQTIL